MFLVVCSRALTVVVVELGVVLVFVFLRLLCMAEMLIPFPGGVVGFAHVNVLLLGCACILHVSHSYIVLRSRVTYFCLSVAVIHSVA